MKCNYCNKDVKTFIGDGNQFPIQLILSGHFNQTGYQQCQGSFKIVD